MKKISIKVYLDYIPLSILCVTACTLIWTISTTDILLAWKHYFGLILLPIIAFLFYKKHLFGVLSIGLTLVLGLIGLISFSPEITIYTFGFGNSTDRSINIIRIQPIFLLWLLIHFILSGRYYVGILSKKYWQNLRTQSMIKSRIFRIIFLKETLLLLFALVWFWFSIGLWVDSNYSEDNLKPYYGTITRIDSVITRVKDKPLYKEITKQLRVSLNTDGDKVFTLLTTKNFGYVTSKVFVGDTVTLFTKPKVWGIFGLKKSSDINHLIKNEIVIINYQDYKKSISGFFYFTFAFAVILFIVYIIKLRKRLRWDFDGYKKFQGSI